MFVIDMSPTFFWTVQFTTPAADGTGAQVCEFEAEFKRLGLDDLRELGTRQRDTGLTDERVCAELVVGWRGVTDKAGRDVKFSAEALARVLQIPGVPVAVLSAHTEALRPPSGKSSAAEKN